MPTDKLSTNLTAHAKTLSLRTPEKGDAKRILQLVRESNVLEVNSCYAYLLLCEHFRETCVVAEHGTELAGFVAAYLPPNRKETVFVWQVGVANDFRKQGLGKRILLKLLTLPACRTARYLETTVTPSNTASQRLFRSVATDLGVPIKNDFGFSAELFDGSDHEEEYLYRIGPLPIDRISPGFFKS